MVSPEHKSASERPTLPPLPLPLLRKQENINFVQPLSFISKTQCEKVAFRIHLASQGDT